MTKEEKREYDKQYRLKHLEKIRERVRKHRLDNLAHYTAKTSENYFKNKTERRKRGKAWYEKNKARCHTLELARYHNDPITKLKSAVRVGLNRAIKYGNTRKAHPSIVYLGCTIEEFKTHIESQFKEGMSWDNHGEWHLDHKKPLSLLSEVTDVEMLKELCHYTNYQPLWKDENLSKYDKMI
jgi:hypothetical protein